ncbi:MAG: molybdopterin-dependent oxidoreductase, partial [Gemmatimonadaceae bacterium]
MSTDTTTSGVKRRDFLKVIGATTAATTMIGCSSERVEKLIPYLVSPDATVPGVSTYYATTCRECSAACGVIAETRDGRTIKLEGNPEHPLNRGALCARGQSALQGLYNPDRYRGPMVRRNGRLEATTWDDALKLFAEKLGEVGGNAGNAVFINRHESGSFPAFLNSWLAGYGIPAALSIDPDADHAAIAANRQSYGVAWPRLDFSATRLIISFGADFLDGWGASVAHQLDFAEARAKLAGAPRLIYVGPRRSLTGLNADQWIDARPGAELAIVGMLGGSVSPSAAAAESGVAVASLTALKQEFDAARPAMVLAGGNSPRGMELCLAANALNAAGGAINAAQAINSFEGIDAPSQLRALGQRMQAGTVPMLMVRNVDPVYAMPASSGFTGALAKVRFKVSFSSIPDETSALADLVLPDNHSLESWGDAEPVRGTLSLQQPAMDPVFNTRSTADVLLAVSRGKAAAEVAAGPPPSYRTLFISRFPGGAAGLAAALPRGVASGSSLPTASPRAVPAPVAATASAGDYFLHVYASPALGRGDGANKPWLQELPDPVTKIAWQTVAEIHPATAKKLGVQNGDHVVVETSAGKLSLPVYAYPGVRQDTVAIAAGRGHADVAGRYAKAGHNAFDLLPYSEDRSGAVNYSTSRAKVTRDGEFSRLVTTEGSSRQHGRGIGQAVLAAKLGHAEGAGGEHAGAEGGGEPEVPGDASHEFLPGLRSPTANDAQGSLGGPELKSKEKGMYDPN